ncbi:hypothetical protein GJ496_002451 [Pomphorhynchus laevis]|nr:hypothetical protein GJ496_002451 [Pomphorhynchus laevis]
MQNTFRSTDLLPSKVATEEHCQQLLNELLIEATSDKYVAYWTTKPIQIQGLERIYIRTADGLALLVFKTEEDKRYTINKLDGSKSQQRVPEFDRKLFLSTKYANLKDQMRAIDIVNELWNRSDSTSIARCLTMCPLRETLMRSRLMPFEKDRYVKEYKRASADQLQSDPNDLRPAYPTLLETVAFLCRLCKDGITAELFHFVSHRLHAVRKDLIQQNVISQCNADKYEKNGNNEIVQATFQCLEVCVRFHVYSALKLIDQSVDAFSPTLNDSQIRASLSSLLQCNSKANQFKALSMIHSTMIGANPLTPIENVNSQLTDDPYRDLALAVHRCVRTNDSIHMWKIFSVTSKSNQMLACAILRLTDRIVSKSLEVLVQHQPHAGCTGLLLAKSILGSDDLNELSRFGYSVENSCIVGKFKSPEPCVSRHIEQIIPTNKLSYYLYADWEKQIVLEDPISFDCNGYFIGLVPESPSSPRTRDDDSVARIMNAYSKSKNVLFPITGFTGPTSPWQYESTNANSLDLFNSNTLSKSDDVFSWNQIGTINNVNLSQIEPTPNTELTYFETHTLDTKRSSPEINLIENSSQHKSLFTEISRNKSGSPIFKIDSNQHQPEYQIHKPVDECDELLIDNELRCLANDTILANQPSTPFTDTDYNVLTNECKASYVPSSDYMDTNKVLQVEPIPILNEKLLSLANEFIDSLIKRVCAESILFEQILYRIQRSLLEEHVNNYVRTLTDEKINEINIITKIHQRIIMKSIFLRWKKASQHFIGHRNNISVKIKADICLENLPEGNWVCRIGIYPPTSWASLAYSESITLISPAKRLDLAIGPVSSYGCSVVLRYNRDPKYEVCPPCTPIMNMKTDIPKEDHLLFAIVNYCTMLPFKPNEVNLRKLLDFTITGCYPHVHFKQVKLPLLMRVITSEVQSVSMYPIATSSMNVARWKQGSPQFLEAVYWSLVNDESSVFSIDINELNMWLRCTLSDMCKQISSLLDCEFGIVKSIPILIRPHEILSSKKVRSKCIERSTSNEFSCAGNKICDTDRVLQSDGLRCSIDVSDKNEISDLLPCTLQLKISKLKRKFNDIDKLATELDYMRVRAINQ